MTCISDEVFAAWISGELDQPELEHAEGHAADCATCRGIAIAMLGLVPRLDATLGAVGATIGRYRVVGTLGHGAMGVVMHGHDPVLERDVAIKMVNAIAATDEQRARMLHEAKMLALVDHPNVVRVHDAGIVDDEVFVAMEYVTGTTLVAWLAESPRSLEARLEVLAGAGAGIAAIHAAGVVHRDIKPDNIVVRERRAVIVDFGLARAAGGSGPAGSGIAGTPRFLAPEVRAGGPATEHADQFAWWTVVDDTLREIVLPPRQRAALAAAIARGTAGDPEGRFPTMRDAVAALAAACEPRRRPRVALAATAAAAGVAIAVAIALVIADRPERAAAAVDHGTCTRSAERLRTTWAGGRDQARAAFVATGAAFAQTSFDRAAGLYDTFVPALVARIDAACRAAPVDEPAALTQARRRCLDERAVDLAAEIDRLVTADRRTVLLAVDRAWALVEPACEDARALMFGGYGVAAVAPDLAARGTRARALLREGKPDEGIPLVEAVLADARARGDRSGELAALQLLGELHDSMERTDPAIEAFQQAHRLAEEQGRDLDAARLLALLAQATGVGKRDAAGGHRFVAMARAKAQRIGGTNHVLLAYLHRAEAQIFELELRCREAEAEIRQALARYQAAYGPDHPHVGMVLSELTHMACDDGPELVDAATRALAIIERTYGADHPNTGRALGNLANRLDAVGRPANAREHLVRADAIFVRALGEDHPARIPGLYSLGDVEAALGHRAAALDALRKALQLVDATDGPESPRASSMHAAIGDVLRGEKQFAAALAEYRRALDIGERSLGKDHVQLLRPLEGIARAELGAGRPQAAIPHVQRALDLATRPDASATPAELARFRALLEQAQQAARTRKILRAR